jgi:hypothetical protein
MANSLKSLGAQRRSRIGRALRIQAIGVKRPVHGLLNDPHFGLALGPELRRETDVSILIGDTHHEPPVPALNPVSGQCDDPIWHA